LFLFSQTNRKNHQSYPAFATQPQSPARNSGINPHSPRYQFIPLLLARLARAGNRDFFFLFLFFLE
jgi:hypothetical protein